MNSSGQRFGPAFRLPFHPIIDGSEPINSNLTESLINVVRFVTRMSNNARSCSRLWDTYAGKSVGQHLNVSFAFFALCFFHRRPADFPLNHFNSGKGGSTFSNVNRTDIGSVPNQVREAMFDGTSNQPCVINSRG